MLSMMSASTVDAAVERTCVGDAHGPHRPVSAISRGRRGRWWRAAARTAAAGAALRNAREDSVTLMYHSHLGLAVITVQDERAQRPERALQLYCVYIAAAFAFKSVIH